MDLLPACKLACVPVRRLIDDAPRDDRAAAIERRAEPLQLLGTQPEFGLEVLQLGRGHLREVAPSPRPAGIRLFHPLRFGAADRVEQHGQVLGHEQVLAAVDGEDSVSAGAELAEPGELRRRPPAEAGAVGPVGVLVASLEQARQSGIGGARGPGSSASASADALNPLIASA